MTFVKTIGAAAAVALGLAGAAGAETTRVTYKSAKTGSSYYQMAVQIAEAMKAGTDGDIAVTVEESQGSVQNVMEVRARRRLRVHHAPRPRRAGAGRQGDVRG